MRKDDSSLTENGPNAAPSVGGDCRTCKHNTYIEIKDCSFVDCNHPLTLERGPKYQVGDPLMVSWRTADVHVRELHQLQGCPTYEAHENQMAQSNDQARSGTPTSGA